MSNTPRVVLLLRSYTAYDRGLLAGIARYAQLHGRWVLCLPGEHPGMSTFDSNNLDEEETFRRRATLKFPLKTPLDLQRLGATGFIGRIQTPEIAETLLASKLPLIAVELYEEQLADDNLLSKVSEVCADSHRAGRIAAEHFLERGFVHFGFCGYRGRIWSQRRQEGFAQRLEESGHTCHFYEPPGGSQVLLWNSEQRAVISWLQSLPKPAAVMACNDIRGRQVIEACLQAGLHVPDDVAVVGVDKDRLLCELANPPLSSVELNLERAGYQAAELLDGLMSGKIKTPQKIFVEPMWVVSRRSSDVIAVDDTHVGAALRFIRDNLQRPIAVDDIVEHTGISRRNLEMRFQHILSRSIRQHIRLTRLAWSKKLLVETNLPAEKIAELSGFASPSHLSRVFHSEFGMTLSQYRRQSRNP